MRTQPLLLLLPTAAQNALPPIPPLKPQGIWLQGVVTGSPQASGSETRRSLHTGSPGWDWNTPKQPQALGLTCRVSGSVDCRTSCTMSSPLHQFVPATDRLMCRDWFPKSIPHHPMPAEEKRKTQDHSDRSMEPECSLPQRGEMRREPACQSRGLEEPLAQGTWPLGREEGVTHCTEPRGTLLVSGEWHNLQLWVCFRKQESRASYWL